MRRNENENCKVCLEPQHCDCDCNTCQRTKALMQPMEMENALVRFLRTDTMNVYIVSKQDPDMVTKYENVVTINKLLDNTVILWTRNKHGANHHYELKDVISLESN